MEKSKVISFEDLDVYQRAYAACLRVMREVVPFLPASEKFDLKDQMSRACKSIPRLISEGFAKKYQKAGFQRYLTDGIGESNEMIVCLSHTRDLYSEYVPIQISKELIEEYRIICKQLFKLGQKWSSFTGPKTSSQHE